MKISRRLKYALAVSVIFHLIFIPLLPGPGEVDIPKPDSEIIRLSLEPLERATPPPTPPEEEHPPERTEAEPEEVIEEAPPSEPAPPEAQPEEPAEPVSPAEDPPPETPPSETPGEQPDPETEQPLLQRGGMVAGSSSAERQEDNKVRGFETPPRRFAADRNFVEEQNRPDIETPFEFHEPDPEDMFPEDVKVEFATGPASEISPDIPYPDVQQPAEGSTIRSPISQPLPRMPSWLEEEGERVKVVVSYDVNREGYLENLTIRSSSGYRAVDVAVLEALRRWRYEAGEPLSGQVTVFRFILSP